MSDVALALVVIRSQDIEKSKDFYEKLGLVFQQEQHGKGLVHYSCRLGGAVLEIYPLGKEQSPTMNRLGFLVSDLQKVFGDVKTAGAEIAREPAITEWGFTAWIKDPEGRVVELTQK